MRRAGDANDVPKVPGEPHVPRTDLSRTITPVSTRSSLNLTQSVRCRRETYFGPSIPQPVEPSAGPELGAERRQLLNLALVLVLEKLSPKERAAYVLRQAFDYSYRQIAECLHTEEAHARQLVSCAQRHIAGGRCVPVSESEHRRLLLAFNDAAHAGDFAALEGLFARSGKAVSQHDGMFDLGE
jgi:RNA polymerase sigma-70 factor (ECF subfamily)